MPDQKQTLMRTIKHALGFPSKKTISYIADVLLRYRLMVFIYLLILASYFIFLHNKFPDQKENFYVSFSASVLEDLIMFIFLTIGVTFISIKLSNINPEDYDYERRIRALMNSDNVKDDKRAYNYLQSELSRLLTYNKVMNYEVSIIDHYPTQNAYAIVTKRTHIITNMCKDKEFENKRAPIIIEPDIKVGLTYGKLNYLIKLDPKNLNTQIETILHEGSPDTELNAGDNNFSIPNIKIGKDSETAFVLSYTCFSGIRENSLPEAWLYSEAIKYTSNVKFSIVNNLKSKKNIKIDFRTKNREGAINNIVTNHVLLYGESNKYEHDLDYSLLPSERLEFYFHNQE